MNYLVVDLEATCCDDGSIPKDEMETIEIGAVLTSSEDFDRRIPFSQFVCPVKHPVLTDFCKDLTTISQKDVDTAPLFPEAMERFGVWATWSISVPELVFCSWGRFDPVQLEKDCLYHHVRYPFYSHCDLARIFRDKTRRKKGNRGAMKYFGLEPVGTHHRGVDDAMNAARMLPLVLNL